MPSTDPIIDALEAARAELLDTGLRNPLVRFRPSSRHGVEIVDERSAEVFRILVAEGRDMDFLPAPDADSAASALAQPATCQLPGASAVGWANSGGARMRASPTNIAISSRMPAVAAGVASATLKRRTPA